MVEGPHAENSRGAALSRDVRRPERERGSTGADGGSGSGSEASGGIGHVIGTPSQSSNSNLGARS